MGTIIIDEYTCQECGFHGEFEHDLIDGPDNLTVRCGSCGRLLYLIKAPQNTDDPVEELVRAAQGVLIFQATVVKNKSYPAAIRRLKKAIKNARVGQVSDERLRQAAQALIDYRRRAGPLNFQLEKADDFLRQIELALKGQVSEPPIHGV